MKCPECQRENSEARKFCCECGAKLLILCPKCSSENLPGDKFCGECGHNLTLPSEPIPKDLSFDEKLDKIQRYLPKGLREKILARRGKIEGERKQVTVMFCDMEGFTQLSEKLGPEEAYNIMDQVYEILIHKVHDYEGTVNEMTGDGIMALFGAPVALEDAPQRALRSSLAIHREMARFSDKIKKEKQGIPPLKMRVGIHTGPVVVGTLGNDLRVEFKAVGDTVNLASRMEGLAEPGSTYVTEETFKLTEGLFRFEALGERKVKGKEAPVNVYHVIAPSTRRTRFDVSAERGLTPFVGRERELELLLDGYQRSKEGRGQAFSVVSEAGLGKSRLLYEFRKAVANENVTFLEGKCLSYSRGVAYHPIIDILKSNFDIQAGDGDAEIREKVKKGLKILRADEAFTLPYLLELLSVKDSGIDKIMMSPEGRKDRITEALKRIVLKGSQIRPLIMTIEDLHWGDKSSEEVLKYLLESIPGVRVFLIFTYRPEFVHVWGAKSFHSQITLNRLSNRESLAMVTYLLGTEDVDRNLEGLILEKAEGVPFFIEEFIRSAKGLKIIEKEDNKYRLAKDILDVSIPSAIQDVIMARVDSLPEGAKAVLQTSSVIEREFSYELIKRVTGLSEQKLLAHLSALKDTELLYERGIYPQSTFIFKHALMREVAYETLLLQRRKVLHGLVGQAIEELYPDRLEEHLNLLQHHFSLAENWQKAVYYGRQAAEKAARLSQFHEAFTMFEQIQEWLNHLPEEKLRQDTLVDILLEQERLCETLGWRKRQQALIDQLLSLLQSFDDPACLAEIKVREGDLYTQLGRFDDAEHALSDSLATWRALSDTLGESRALRSMGFLRWHQGQDKEAITFNEAALAIDRLRDDPTAIATDLTNLGAVWRNLGNHKNALGCLEEALQFYMAAENSAKQAFTRYSIANVHLELGALDRAMEQYQAAHDIFEHHHDRVMASRALAGMANLYWRLGKAQDSLRLYKEVVRITRDIKFGQGLSHSLRTLGELLLVLNERQKALDYLLESTEVFAELRARENEAEVWEKIADIYEQNLEDNQKALSAWERARALWMQVNERGRALEALQRMGQLARQRLGDPSRALQCFREALELAAKIGARKKQGELLNAIGIIEWHLSAHTDALVHYEEALEVFHELEDKAHAGLMLNSIGITLHKLGHYDKALSRLREAVVHNRQAGEPLLEGHGLAAIGDVYRDRGEHEQALDHYRESLDIRRTIGDRKGQGWMLHSLALVYVAQDSHDQARDCLAQARAIAEEFRDVELRHACVHMCDQLSVRQ
ncbi:MAG: tetratricopeptide repeat protein [Pseudomonadota bacterium]